VPDEEEGSEHRHHATWPLVALSAILIDEGSLDQTAWAQLIIIGGKDVENRSRRTSFRGRFAVHVSLKRADYEDVDVEAIPRDLREPMKLAWERNASAGRVIGTVEPVDCVRDSNSIWAIDNYWHWVLRNPRPYSRSRPAKGQLGFWEWAR
jgi:hypothetical protein